MSEIFVISDLHLGHRNIIKAFRYKDFQTIEEHDAAIQSLWNSTVSKRDVVLMLGDIVWHKVNWQILKELNGMKRLIMGNHDSVSLKDAYQYFHSIHGSYKKGDIVFTHIPIHPQELVYRNWKYNVHGHTHAKSVDDWRYFNACPEQNGYAPIPLEQIKTEFKNRQLKNEIS